MKISILGRGAFGEAICQLLSENGFKPTFADKGQYIQDGADVVFLCVPLQSLREALEFNKEKFLSETIFVNCSKGIEKKTLKLPFEIVEEIVGRKKYCSLAGLSFAEEIKNERPTIVSLGCEDGVVAETIKKIIQTPYFEVETTKYFQAVELAGAIKNVYAILCGFSDGLGFGSNTKSKIVISAVKEYEMLAEKMGFKYETLALPGIIGDFVLTCVSPQSRNYKFGLNLSKMSPAEALKNSGTTIEGYQTNFSLGLLAEKHNIRPDWAFLADFVIEKGVGVKDFFAGKVATKIDSV